MTRLPLQPELSQHLIRILACKVVGLLDVHLEGGIAGAKHRVKHGCAVADGHGDWQKQHTIPCSELGYRHRVTLPVSRTHATGSVCQVEGLVVSKHLHAYPCHEATHDGERHEERGVQEVVLRRVRVDPRQVREEGEDEDFG